MQHHRSRIPKFGSWDSSDSSTPFTELFDGARGGRSNEEILAGRMKHSHPQKVNPTTDLHRRAGAPVSHQHARKPSREDHSSSSSGHHHRQIEPPAYHIIDDSRYVPQMNHSHSANESGAAARLGEPLGVTITGATTTTNAATANASKNSPHRSGRNGNSSSSPSWERKSEASSTPGRSRLRNSSNTTEAEKAPVLPKFGAWDSNDPSSADGFTVIFNNARNVKKAGGSIHIPPLGFHDNDLYPDPKNNATQPPKKKLFCCFQSPEPKA